MGKTRVSRIIPKTLKVWKDFFGLAPKILIIRSFYVCMCVSKQTLGIRGGTLIHCDFYWDLIFQKYIVLSTECPQEGKRVKETHLLLEQKENQHNVKKKRSYDQNWLSKNPSIERVVSLFVE